MAMSDRSLYREVYQLTTESLCASGMRRHLRGVFTREVAVDVVGVVGLNSAKKHGFTINPIIGVSYVPLERLVAELEGREFVLYNGDTIATPIGYLMDPPEYREWPFEAGKHNATMVEAMVHEITTVGFRYMEANKTIEAMCDRIAKDRHFMMHSDVYQLPVGYMMLGRFDEAEKVVRDELAKIAAHKPPTIEEHEAAQGEKLDPEVIAYLEKTKNDPIPAHENYRRFAEAFFERLGQDRRAGHHTGQVG